MIPDERQQHILNALKYASFFSLPELARLLDVSVMTIRRDVAEMSSRGELLAVRGGVRSLSEVVPTADKKSSNCGLVHAALSYLKNHQVVFFDSGEHCRQLARLIPWTPGMTAVTNDFRIADDIVRHTSARLLFIGGELNRKDYSCHKSMALETLNTLSFELLFLSPTYWSENGVRHNDEHLQSWYSRLLSSAQHSIVLADTDNYSPGGMFKLFALNEADVVIANHPNAERLLNGRVDPLKLHPLR